MDWVNRNLEHPVNKGENEVAVRGGEKEKLPMTDQTVCGSYIMKERRLLALHTETAGIMPMIQKAIK